MTTKNPQSVQRYGELELSTRLIETRLVANAIFGYNHSDIALSGGKSYEEARLEKFTMDESSTPTTPLQEEAVPDPKATKDAEEPVAKRVCTIDDLRNTTDMIKIEVGKGDNAWMLHKDLLLAKSEFAKMAVSHDCQEKTTGIIKLPEADPEAFHVFFKHIYTEKLDAASLSTDQLLEVYFLSDYLICPKLSDLAFQQVYVRTHNVTFLYTAKQIIHVLSRDLVVESLRMLVLDQVGRGILQKKYDPSTMEDHTLFEPVMKQLMDAVVRAVREINIILPGNSSTPTYPPISYYLGHDVQSETQTINAPPVADAVTASTQFEAEVGRGSISYVMEQTNVSRLRAVEALRIKNNSVTAAVRYIRVSPHS